MHHLWCDCEGSFMSCSIVCCRRRLLKWHTNETNGCNYRVAHTPGAHWIMRQDESYCCGEIGISFNINTLVRVISRQLAIFIHSLSCVAGLLNLKYSFIHIIIFVIRFTLIHFYSPFIRVAMAPCRRLLLARESFEERMGPQFWVRIYAVRKGYF